MAFDWSNPMNSMVVFAAVLGAMTSVCRTLLEQRGQAQRPGVVAPYLLLFATGLFGATVGLVTAFKAVAVAGPDAKTTILQVGISLALEPLLLALLLTAFLVLVDGIGALMGSTRPQALKTSSRAGLAVVTVTGLLCLTGSIRLLVAGQAFVLGSGSGEVGRAAVSSMKAGIGSAGALSMAAVALGLGLVALSLIRGGRDLTRSAHGRIDAAVAKA
jgi:hypothetical protein